MSIPHPSVALQGGQWKGVLPVPYSNFFLLQPAPPPSLLQSEFPRQPPYSHTATNFFVCFFIWKLRLREVKEQVLFLLHQQCQNLLKAAELSTTVPSPHLLPLSELAALLEWWRPREVKPHSLAFQPKPSIGPSLSRFESLTSDPLPPPSPKSHPREVGETGLFHNLGFGCHRCRQVSSSPPRSGGFCPAPQHDQNRPGAKLTLGPAPDSSRHPANDPVCGLV